MLHYSIDMLKLIFAAWILRGDQDPEYEKHQEIFIFQELAVQVCDKAAAGIWHYKYYKAFRDSLMVFVYLTPDPS